MAAHGEVASTTATTTTGSTGATTRALAGVALRGAVPGAMLMAALNALRVHGSCQAWWRSFALVFAALVVPSFVALFRVARAHLTGRDEQYVRDYLDAASHGRLELVAGVVALGIVGLLYYTGRC